jgi:hypothetical protein
MKAHGIECCHGAGKSRSSWPRGRGAVGGVLFAVLLALMPKCPMCIAAWLGVIGLSGLAARVDPRAVWLSLALAVALAATLATVHFEATIAHRLLGRGETKKGKET